MIDWFLQFILHVNRLATSEAHGGLPMIKLLLG